MDGITRRQTLKGGSAAAVAAGAWYLRRDLIGQAQAQTGTEPRIQLGQDWEIDDYQDSNGDTNLRIRHIPSGAELYWSNQENSWVFPSITTSDVFVDNVGLRAGPTSGNVSVPSGSVTTIPLDSDAGSDPQNELDAANDRITVADSGDYLLVGAVKWAASTTVWSTGDRAKPYIYVNGSIVFSANTTKVGESAQTVMIFLAPEPLSAGDNVQLKVFQDSGDTQEVVDSLANTYLSVIQLG